MFSKTYKLTQEQIDQSNELYRSMKEEIAFLQETIEIQSKSFLFQKAKALEAENIKIKQELVKCRKDLETTNYTLSAVLQKLDVNLRKMNSSKRRYKEEVSEEVPNITANELDFLA